MSEQQASSSNVNAKLWRYHTTVAFGPSSLFLVGKGKRGTLEGFSLIFSPLGAVSYHSQPLPSSSRECETLYTNQIPQTGLHSMSRRRQKSAHPRNLPTKPSQSGGPDATAYFLLTSQPIMPLRQHEPLQNTGPSLPVNPAIAQLDASTDSSSQQRLPMGRLA